MYGYYTSLQIDFLGRHNQHDMEMISICDNCQEPAFLVTKAYLSLAAVFAIHVNRNIGIITRIVSLKRVGKYFTIHSASSTTMHYIAVCFQENRKHSGTKRNFSFLAYGRWTKRNLIQSSCSLSTDSNCLSRYELSNLSLYVFGVFFKYHSARDRYNRQLSIGTISLFQSYKATKDWSTSDWYKHIEVTFLGEEGKYFPLMISSASKCNSNRLNQYVNFVPGLDWGGLRREWFQLLCTELFEKSGLFVKLSDSSQSLVSKQFRIIYRYL